VPSRQWDPPGLSYPIAVLKLELLFAALSQLIRKLRQEVMTANKCESADSWADITSNNDFNLSVADSVSILPALISYFLNLHLRLRTNCLQHDKNETPYF
jgi:hypothetical protein